jgi:hypothetical protein
MRAPPFVYAASVVAPDQELAVRGRMTLDLEQLNPKKTISYTLRLSVGTPAWPS